jgi:hypothetical protein
MYVQTCNRVGMECVLLATSNAVMVLELVQGYTPTSDESPIPPRDQICTAMVYDIEGGGGMWRARSDVLPRCSERTLAPNR